MATVARAIRSELLSNKPEAIPRRELGGQAPVQRVKLDGLAENKILLQPRLCTLRSYGSDRGGVLKTRKEEAETPPEGGEVSSFYDILSEYIESSKKSQDFEIISGRLAMVLISMLKKQSTTSLSP